MNKIRIGLDIDQCICDFWNPYCERYGTNNTSKQITRNINRQLKYDAQFWLNLPVLNVPDFKPELFCTKRIVSKAITKKYLFNLGFTNIPCYQLFYQRGDKSRLIKGRCDLFVDDSIQNFIDLNLHGVPCLLMNTDMNQSIGDIGRVYSLNKEELLETGYHFMKNYYPNIREIIQTLNINNLY